MIFLPKECQALTLYMLGKKRPRKQVSFSEKPAQLGERSVVSAEELQNMWYQRKEFAMFKLEARDYILGRDENMEARGFERYNLEWATNKSLAKKCTLLAIKKGMSADDVAMIAQKCSAWSQNEAFKLACKDYCEVYHPDMLDGLSALPMARVDYSSTDISNNKRTTDSAEQEGRRVRIRSA
jgi:hypothetical protein